MKRFSATRVRATENTPREAFVIALVVLLLAPAAHAGIADSPLPTLVPGKKTFHVYSESTPGYYVGICATYYNCTSTDTAPMQVGVEVFGAPGGSAFNDPVATSLTVAPGATVTFFSNS